MDILDGLNPAQREAVEAINGPVLILAGPGSGKTRVITHRVAYLIKVCGVSPHRIMAVTFTNKAAREMKERLLRMVSSSVNDLTIGTFHATCARILRIDGRAIGIPPEFVIYDDEDQLSVLKKALVALNLDPKQYAPKAIQQAISEAKSQMVSPADYKRASRSYFDEVVRRVYERYEAALGESGALDFDDLLLKMVKLFKDNPEILVKYQLRYLHIMVDEFQDTNTVQYELIKLLGGKYRNICVVGDPDQSIYSWRFADLRNILSFEKDYLNAKVVLLEQNYRSSKIILDTASHVIEKNKQRKARHLFTENEEGEPVSVVEAYSETEEAQFVVKEVSHLTGLGKLRMGDIAVMYRTNAQSRVLEEAFIRYGLPYRLAAGTRFYERREIKDILAYFRLIQNPNDSVSLLRILNVPGRGIGEKTSGQLSFLARSLGVSEYKALTMLEDKDSEAVREQPFSSQMVRTLSGFRQILQDMIQAGQEKSVVDLFDFIVDKLHYREYLMSTPEGDERWENVQELRTVTQEYLSLASSEGTAAFLQGVSLVSDVDGLKESADAVTLITLHQAKGLEFPVVFIVGMEDGILPHVRSFDDPSQMEEERRLCYVGITRAKKKLYLVRAFRRSFMGSSGVNEPSRFLGDIPDYLIAGGSGWREEKKQMAETQYVWNRPPMPGSTPEQSPKTDLIKLKPGDRVRHTAFGEGLVLSYQETKDDAEAVITFKSAGTKKLLMSFARLEKIG